MKTTQPPPRPSRLRAYRLGFNAESRAAMWLRLHLWRILERRYDRGGGEVDIIALRGRTLAFVEVKARANEHSGLEAVTAMQRRRIVRGAEGFVARNPRFADYDMRFDVIVMRPRGLPLHLRGAFDAGR